MIQNDTVLAPTKKLLRESTTWLTGKLLHFSLNEVQVLGLISGADPLSTKAVYHKPGTAGLFIGAGLAGWRISGSSDASTSFFRREISDPTRLRLSIRPADQERARQHEPSITVRVGIGKVHDTLVI
jgi:hypothetical protein